MTRPNILLIHSDQHRFDCLGVNGHPLLQTPHLDQLAREGINFTHAFCAIPVCVPARNSLLTGQWPTQHNVIANWQTEAKNPPAASPPTFSAALRDAGYRLEYVGKWHDHPTKSPLDHGFHSYIPSEAYEPWRAERGIQPLPSANGWFGDCDPFASLAQTRLGWGADHTIQALEGCAQQKQPFFVRWDPSEPHIPNIVPEPFCSMYSPQAIQPWSGFPDPLAGKPYIQRQQRRTWRTDDWTWQQWAPLVSRYLGEITLMDMQIGRILQALERLDLARSTLVVYTSDHGDMCGSHGMIDKHHVMYDDVMRVPLIMRWPEHVRAARQCDAFVSHSIDLPSTFCEVAGVPLPDSFRGQSLLPLLYGAADNGRNDVFATYHGSQFGLYSQRMVRDRAWKYIWNATAQDELYDLAGDPGEIHNRATDPAAAPELARLRGRLVDWMDEAGDPLLNEWTKPQLLEGLSV